MRLALRILRALLLILLLAAPAFAQDGHIVAVCHQGEVDCSGTDFTGSDQLVYFTVARSAVPVDANGNTYTLVGTPAGTGGLTQQFAYISQHNPTITAGMAFYVYGGGTIVGLSGTYSADIDIDQQVQQPGSPVTLAGTPQKDGEIILSANDGCTVATSSSPLTLLDSRDNLDVSVAAQIQTTAASVTQTWTCAGGTPYNTGAVLISLFSAAHPPDVQFTTTTLDAAEQGLDYHGSTCLAVKYGTPPYTFTLDSSSAPLPAGITLGSDGCWTSGSVPTVNGDFAGLVFKVTDSASGTALSSPLTLKVYPTPPAPGPGAPVFLGHTAVYQGISPGMDTHGASAIIVATTCDSHGATISPPFGDSSSNTYTRAFFGTSPGYIGVCLWQSLNPTTSINTTFSASSGTIVEAQAWAHIASGPDHDSYQNEGQPITAGPITPSNDHALIVSPFASQFGTGPAPSPFTASDVIDWNTTGLLTLGFAYQVQDTSAPVSNSWDWPGGVNGAVAAIVSYCSTLSPCALVVTTTHLTEEIAGQPCVSHLAASGGIAPYHWSLDASSAPLPSGVTLNDDGSFTCSGTVAAVTPGLVFKATDSEGTPVSAVSTALSFGVAATALTITSSSCPGGTQYVAYAGCTITTSGGIAPVSVSATYGLPEGLTLNPSTGVISGTVYGEGTYATQFAAADSFGAVAGAGINIPIDGNNDPQGCSFPSNHAYNLRVYDLPVDTSPAATPVPYSDQHLRFYFGGAPGPGPGMPWIVVPADQPDITLTAAPTNDNQFISGPIPSYAPTENTHDVCSGGDHHTIVLQKAGNGHACRLYEQYQSSVFPDGTWGPDPSCGGVSSGFSNAWWPDMTGYDLPAQDEGTTDAAGLPVWQYLITFDQVQAAIDNGSMVVPHAIRFTLNQTLRDYVWPATARSGVGSCSGGYHDANGLLAQSDHGTGGAPTSCTQQGPDGEIYRLERDVDVDSLCSGDQEAIVVGHTLQQYGGIVADKGNSWAFEGTADHRWQSDFSCLANNLTGGNFEPVMVDQLAADWPTSGRVKTANSVILSGVQIQTGSVVQQ